MIGASAGATGGSRVSLTGPIRATGSRPTTSTSQSGPASRRCSARRALNSRSVIPAASTTTSGPSPPPSPARLVTKSRNSSVPRMATIPDEAARTPARGPMPSTGPPDGGWKHTAQSKRAGHCRHGSAASSTWPSGPRTRPRTPLARRRGLPRDTSADVRNTFSAFPSMERTRPEPSRRGASSGPWSQS